ncbi:MAG TPA: hypothetical protein VHA33_27180 [Candidatus Angelobacter sp.]|jgi:hypothetical protein|nr:hypothetical protein [Candidatus Angelobacter sp.]
MISKHLVIRRNTEEVESKLTAEAAELRSVAEPQPKNRFTAKDAKAAKENQNPNHKGTRRETQGHEEKKQKDSSRENKIFKVSNAEDLNLWFMGIVVRNWEG